MVLIVCDLKTNVNTQFNKTFLKVFFFGTLKHLPSRGKLAFCRWSKLGYGKSLLRCTPPTNIGTKTHKLWRRKIRNSWKLIFWAPWLRFCFPYLSVCLSLPLSISGFKVLLFPLSNSVGFFLSLFLSLSFSFSRFLSPYQVLRYFCQSTSLWKFKRCWINFTSFLELPLKFQV